MAAKARIPPPLIFRGGGGGVGECSLAGGAVRGGSPDKAGCRPPALPPKVEGGDNVNITLVIKGTHPGGWP